MTVADVRVQLDRPAAARKELRVPEATRGIPAFCRQVADLWSAEARLWTILTSAADFPLGTHHGALPALTAGCATQFAGDRALSWATSGGSRQVTADKS